MKTIYLAGPIAGLTYETATAWRDEIKNTLSNYGIHAVSPMRDKAHLSQEKILTNLGYEQRPLTSQKGIVTRDRMDCTTSDVVLMNLLGTTSVSIGSMVELGWADAARVPIVTVIDLNDNYNPHVHAFVKELSGFIVPTLDAAVDIVLSLLGHSRCTERYGLPHPKKG